MPRAISWRAAAWLLLLAGAGALRWVQWSRSATLFNDGPRFLASAQDFSRGEWAAFLAQPQHPLYPIAVAVLHALGLGWEDAGALVSVLGGCLAIGMLALFFRDAFGSLPAWLGAGLLAVHTRFVEYSSDVQSDGLYIGLFAAGVWWLWYAWSRASRSAAAAAGLAAGLAYLTRPEGLGLVLVMVALAGISWLRSEWSASRAMGIVAAFSATAALCVVPYVVAVRVATGEIALSRKKSVVEMAGGATAPRATAPPPAATPFASGARIDPGADGRAVDAAASPSGRALAAAQMLARTAKSAFRYGLLALLGVGLLAARGRPTRRAVFVVAIAGLYAGILYALTLQSGYVSRRHALPPLLPLFGYVGFGACAIGAVLASHAARRATAAPLIATGIAAIVAGGELATQRVPRRDEERAARAAAEWLRGHGAPGLLATDRSRLGYYAGMPYIPLQRVDEASLASLLGQHGVRYLLSDDPIEIEVLRRTSGARIRPIHSERVGEREAWVFERVEPVP
jgi:hypothetical protein